MRRIQAIFLTLTLAVSAFLARAPLPATAQDSGNAYTSDTYGFRISWDDRIWFVIDQGPEDGWDELVLSDGIAYVFIAAGVGYNGQLQPCVDDAAQSVSRSPGNGNVTPLTGDDGEPVRGEDDDHAYAAYTYTYGFSDGDSIDFIRYIECRPLIAGESVVAADVVVPEPAYDEEFPLAQELLGNLTLPSPGEAAPVFLSDQWRLAVVAAERGSRIRAANLSPRSDRDWLAVVVDVTNWGTADDELNVRDFELRLDGEDTLVRLAPASTVAAAEELDTEPASSNRAVSIPAGQTERLTLVFQIPETANDPALVRAGSTLPLDAVLSADTDLADLPPTLGPPFLREARVDSQVGGELLRITFLSDDETAIVRLAGADAPRDSDCYGAEVAEAIDGIVGKTVRVEREPGTPVGPSIVGYLWTETDDGLPVLFNQQLIAGGFAGVPPDGTSGRFGAWLLETEQTAKATEQGLWSECTGPHGQPLTTPGTA